MLSVGIFYRKKEIIIAFVVYYHCSHGFEYHMNQRYCTGHCKMSGIKVIIEKSRVEGALMEQDTIENVS